VYNISEVGEEMESKPPAQPPEPKKPTTSTGLEENVAALLCYVGWWVSGIVFLILEDDNKLIRFHAFQSIIVFGAFTLLLIIFGWIPVVHFFMVPIIALIAIALWIALMVKAYQGGRYKLWAAGDMAERWAKGTPAPPPTPPQT